MPMPTMLRRLHCHGAVYTLSYYIWLIYQSEMSGFDISILSHALPMKASENWNIRSAPALKFYPKPVAQWSKCLLLAFRSKGHRFESPPGYEPPTVSECQSVSGTSLTLVSSAGVRPCQQCWEGYIAMVLCHTLFYSIYSFTSSHIITVSYCDLLWWE